MKCTFVIEQFLASLSAEIKQTRVQTVHAIHFGGVLTNVDLVFVVVAWFIQTNISKGIPMYNKRLNRRKGERTRLYRSWERVRYHTTAVVVIVVIFVNVSAFSLKYMYVCMEVHTVALKKNREKFTYLYALKHIFVK